MGIVSEKSNLKATYQEPLIPPNTTTEKLRPIINRGVNYFTDTNAKGFIKNTGSNRDTNFIIGSNTITKANVIDSRGNVTLPFNEKKRAPNTKDDPNPSRLLLKHTKNFGDYYTGVNTLNDYYAQSKGSGVLGYFNESSYRNNNIVGFDQPFVIKDVGDRWGPDKIEQFTNNPKIANIINVGVGFISGLAGAVLGRSPGEYVGNALGNLQRTGKFLLTPQGIGFLAKQKRLMSGNAQESRTDVRYGLTGNKLKQSENTRKYFPLSLIGDYPGVTKININTPDPTLVIGGYLNSIASLISEGAFKLASAVGTRVISLGASAIGLVGGLVGGALSNLGGAVGKPPAFNIGIKIPSISLNVPIPNIDFLKEKANQFGKSAKKLYELGAKEAKELSKSNKLLYPNAKLLSEVGIDRVNMIPYGKRSVANYKKKTEEDLDFIPFRFSDASGNLMVFRAILSGITDTFTPEYASERYVGRPDSVYVYQGTTREISFTFDIYPKSDQELVRLWEKMNYLAGLTYPTWDTSGLGMIAPYCNLTIGDMYNETPGYISSLTYSVQDSGNWETIIAKLPKYIQASCNFVYIGNRLPSSTQKQFEVDWVGEEKYEGTLASKLVGLLGGTPLDLNNFAKNATGAKKAIGDAKKAKALLKSLPL